LCKSTFRLVPKEAKHGFLGTVLTHAKSRQTGKQAYFFSRFNFIRMKRRGNTHFCFFCSGNVGFKPKKVGRFIKREDITIPTNCIEENGYNFMEKHDASHSTGVIGNAQKYNNVWDWLEKEIGKKKDFPFVVSIPQV